MCCIIAYLTLLFFLLQLKIELDQIKKEKKDLEDQLSAIKKDKVSVIFFVKLACLAST